MQIPDLFAARRHHNRDAATARNHVLVDQHALLAEVLPALLAPQFVRRLRRGGALHRRRVSRDDQEREGTEGVEAGVDRPARAGDQPPYLRAINAPTRVATLRLTSSIRSAGTMAPP